MLNYLGTGIFGTAGLTMSASVLGGVFIGLPIVVAAGVTGGLIGAIAWGLKK